MVNAELEAPRRAGHLEHLEFAEVVRPKLRRELGRVDTVCLLITGIVAIDTIGAVARGGAGALTWLGIVAVLFFVPAALVVAELGTAFPDEGGPYVWARLAFGRFVGALNAFLYWVEAPVWLGGSLAIVAVTVIHQFVGPLEGGWRLAVALTFVWATILVALLPVNKGKWFTASGAVAQVLLLAFFTVSAAIYAARHGVHGIAAGDLAPAWTGFFVVAPVLVYSFIGFELPSSAAGEMRNPMRDVPGAIARAGTLTLILYAVPTLAILLVLPTERITGLGGLIDAMRSVFTVYGGYMASDGTPVLTGAGHLLGSLAAAAFVWVLLTNGLAWVMSSARNQAIACLDGAGPRRLGRFSERTGTPVAMILVSGLVATLVSVAAFAVSGNDADRYFAMVLGLSIALLALANLLVFPALVRLRRTLGHVPRPFRVPGGAVGAWLASGLSTAWCLLAIAAVLFPGLGLADPDASLPAGFEGQRLAFTLSELVPLAILGTIATVFCLVGDRRDRIGAIGTESENRALFRSPTDSTRLVSSAVEHRDG